MQSASDGDRAPAIRHLQDDVTTVVWASQQQATGTGTMTVTVHAAAPATRDTDQGTSTSTAPASTQRAGSDAPTAATGSSSWPRFMFVPLCAHLIEKEAWLPAVTVCAHVAHAVLPTPATYGALGSALYGSMVPRCGWLVGWLVGGGGGWCCWCVWWCWCDTMLCGGELQHSLVACVGCCAFVHACTRAVRPHAEPDCWWTTLRCEPRCGGASLSGLATACFLELSHVSLALCACMSNVACCLTSWCWLP